MRQRCGRTYRHLTHSGLQSIDEVSSRSARNSEMRYLSIKLQKLCSQNYAKKINGIGKFWSKEGLRCRPSWNAEPLHCVVTQCNANFIIANMETQPLTISTKSSASIAKKKSLAFFRCQLFFKSHIRLGHSTRNLWSVCIYECDEFIERKWR